jgi:hypothetical protein
LCQLLPCLLLLLRILYAEGWHQHLWLADIMLHQCHSMLQHVTAFYSVSCAIFANKYG